MASQSLILGRIDHRTGLSWFSKLNCASTLFLIFAGGMVTSTDSGLAVPDWPLSYGMFFPPMIGGVFYEHGHRMIATIVGFFTLVLAVWTAKVDGRRWVRRLSALALATVIFQGILGGLTVKFLLPTPVSVSHAMLAQTFFLLTILLAYVHDRDFGIVERKVGAWKWIVGLLGVLYVQLFLGALMRHTQSGLAVPDFPTMGGSFLPGFDAVMLKHINNFLFEMDLNLVTMNQVAIHMSHRIWATVVLVATGVVVWKLKWPKLLRVFVLILAVQVLLGVMTVLTFKAPVLTSFHVVTGAGLLGLAFLTGLTLFPWKKFGLGGDQ